MPNAVCSRRGNDNHKAGRRPTDIKEIDDVPASGATPDPPTKARSTGEDDSRSLAAGVSGVIGAVVPSMDLEGGNHDVGCRGQNWRMAIGVDQLTVDNRGDTTDEIPRIPRRQRS